METIKLFTFRSHDITLILLSEMARWWISRCRLYRWPVPILGAACTSVFVTLLFFNKIIMNHATCVASCASVKFLSYERLQKNETTKKVKHAAVKSFDVNFLPSNSPIEDRFVAGISDGLGAAMFSVIDGHKGHQCAQYLQKHLLQYVSTALWTEANLASNSDLKVLMDMESIANLDDLLSTDYSKKNWTQASLSTSAIEKCLNHSFVSLDNDISNAGLADIKMVLQGHSLTADMKERVMRAINGACVTMSLMRNSDLFVANTGDCRVVLGQKVGNTWRALPLSVDQNANHPDEVRRIKNAHPGEENTVIIENRVLGNLMPFRTFGDVDFKWEEKYLKQIGIPLTPYYRSPPYITAEPVVTHHQLKNEDKFMIIASDGLWERLTNEEAVKVVAESFKDPNSKFFNFSAMFGSKGKEYCCSQNAATNLLWQALGGTDERVTELLNISPAWSRMYRDDITIIVVFFDSIDRMQ